MKLIDRYEFTNGKAFETYYLSPADTQRFGVPECDVIGFLYLGASSALPVIVMRPDEALIQARMLIDAVNSVTSGYEIELKDAQSAVTIVNPPYFEDNEVCGYCNRPPNSKHEAWCRQ